MLCQICQKNTAILFINAVENGKSKRLALCLPCARERGLTPGNVMGPAEMDPQEMENMGKQISDLFDQFSQDGTMDQLKNMMPPELLDMMKGAVHPGEEDESDQPGTDPAASPDMSGEMPNQDGPSPFFGLFNHPKKEGGADKLRNLRKFSTDLTQKAANGEIDNVVGREDEIDRLMQILNRRTKNNPVLLGEPGVGKTAIAEGFALRIARGEVPVKLRDKQVFLLDMTGLVAGTQFRGQFEGRMKAIINEVIAAKNVILVVDEIHNLVGAGDAQNAMNAANILKPALANGSIQLIGTTTLDEYRKYIEKDAALERRFQPIIVDEPTPEEAVEILEGIKDHYEKYHNVSISKEIIEDAVALSSRYIHQRYLPDKAIDVIDEAGARVNLRNTGLVDLQNLEKTLAVTRQNKDDAASRQDFEAAAKYRIEELKLQKEIDATRRASTNLPLTYDDLAQVIESWTKIPVKRLTVAESQKLLSLEERLHERIIGQEEAVSAVSRAIRRNRSGFRKERKPASFIFAGPTGVGKTELAKTLALELFGSADAMIRIDMSEYMEKHTVSKLIGAPPGYIGFDEGGQLTEQVRRRPFSIILLDEIEKAHPDVFNMLLQILDDGRLTDSQGRTVSFENTVVIMTTNAGASFKNNGLGFNAFGTDQQLSIRIQSALKETFRPEFLNRVDEVITFEPLTRSQLRQIVDLMLKDVYRAADAQHMRVAVSDEVKEYLATNGYDELYGARPLRRLIQRTIEDEIAEAFLRGDVKEGDSLSIELQDGKIVIHP